ncbi:MAG TPA: hypothetical protein VE975_03315 [Actinomycetota bacterium]|nr:hypothetical protein [Actinomycetota bacterium]
MRAVMATGVAGATAALLAALTAPLHAGADNGRPDGRGAGEARRPAVTVAGKVVNGNTGKPAAGVRITLVGPDEARTKPVRIAARTRSSGAFRVRLPSKQARTYALMAHFSGGLFPGRAVSVRPGSRARMTRTVRVWPVTADPAAVRVLRDDIYLVPAKGNRIAALESVTFVNTTQRAYVGRGTRMLRRMGLEVKGPVPAFGFALPQATEPDSVSLVRSDLTVPGVAPVSFGFGITTAVPPGRHRVLYSYTVTSSGAAAYALDRPALYPIRELAVYAAEPLVARGPGLEEAGTVTLRAQTFTKSIRRGAFSPTDAIRITVVAEEAVRPAQVAGMTALALIVAGALFYYFRNRPGRARFEVPSANNPADPRAGLRAIAELDLAYRAGDLDEEEWRKRRRRLKEELAEARGSR